MCKRSPSSKELFRPQAEKISLKPLMENHDLGALSSQLAYRGKKESFLNFKSASAQGSVQRSGDRSFSHSGVSQLWFQFWNPVHPFLAGSTSSQPNTVAAPIKATLCSSGTVLLGWGRLKAQEKTAYLLFLSKCQPFHFPAVKSKGLVTKPSPSWRCVFRRPPGQPASHIGRRLEAVHGVPSLCVLAVLTVECNEIGSWLKARLDLETATFQNTPNHSPVARNVDCTSEEAVVRTLACLFCTLCSPLSPLCYTARDSNPLRVNWKVKCFEKWATLLVWIAFLRKQKTGILLSSTWPHFPFSLSLSPSVYISPLPFLFPIWPQDLEHTLIQLVLVVR